MRRLGPISFVEIGVSISKRSFIEGLQAVDQVLGPQEISQRIRLAIGCVSCCSFDHELDVRVLRGYMKRDNPKANRTPENPELFDCVVATNQSQAWQYVVWIKEILQIFDHVEARTSSKPAFLEMLRLRSVRVESDSADSPSVEADRNGFVLSMGSSVPRRYREVLRRENFREKYSLSDLEKVLFIPAEKIDFLLGDRFEDVFQQALDACR